MSFGWVFTFIDQQKSRLNLRRLFLLHPADRLTGHREGTVHHGSIVSIDTEEVDAVAQAFRIDLDVVAIDFLRHHTLTNSIINLDTHHAFTLDVEHT